MDIVKPGDIIAFSGNSPISKLIKYITRSNISHLGIAVELPTKIYTKSKYMFESTSIGVSKNPLQGRLERAIENNEADKIWMLPLKKELRNSQSKALSEFLNNQIGKSFDYIQAIKSAFDEFDPNPFTYAEENFNEFFCSELVASALEKSKVISNINASEVTPADLCMFNIFKNTYYQLTGESSSINGYNSVSSFGWGK